MGSRKEKVLELRQQIWSEYLNDKNQPRIAKKLGLSQQDISYHIRKLKGEINYRLNVKSIDEFAEYRLRVMDGIEKDIAELSARMEAIEREPKMIMVWAILGDKRHQRKLDLYRVMGDGESVLALRKLKQQQVTQ